VRPFIHLSFAIDQWGRHCGASGEPLLISCAENWQRIHTLREQYDAVAVGAQTWLLDRPRLDVRVERLGRVPSRQPARVVFWGNTSCQPGSPNAPTFLVTQSHADMPGSTVIRTQGRDLDHPLEMLWHLGVRSMLVEGGPTLLGSFLDQDCFDRITVFVRGASLHSALAHARRTLPSLPADPEVKSFGAGTILELDRSDAI
jgi:riboflavin biosynthesis pyrimidine reductase